MSECHNIQKIKENLQKERARALGRRALAAVSSAALWLVESPGTGGSGWAMVVVGRVLRSCSWGLGRGTWLSGPWLLTCNGVILVLASSVPPALGFR